MKIYIHFLPPQKKFTTPSAAFLKKVVTTTLKSEKAFPAGELNIIFVTNKKIRELNKSFLQETGFTDVIAFPYEKPMFGDIYISVDQARINAKRFEERTEKELTRLVVHGVLHILGYTDHQAKKKKIMWAKQEEIVHKFYPRVALKKS